MRLETASEEGLNLVVAVTVFDEFGAVRLNIARLVLQPVTSDADSSSAAASAGSSNTTVVHNFELSEWPE